MGPPQEIARPLAQQLLSAVGERSQGHPTAATARKVATEVGRGMLAERDVQTAEHSDDVVLIADALCEVLGIRGTDRQDLLAAARLHDVGKAAIPGEILEKPGKLTEEEWGEIRAHTAIGAEIIGSVPGLDRVATMIRHSHERWDGDGYPDGLAGGDIPLGSRVIFCADAFHAIRSDRPYRPGRPPAEALAEVRRNAGTQFDPEVVAALDEVVRRLRLVDPRHRRASSTRLAALLLALVVGAGGTAIAKHGLLGVDAADGAGAPTACGLAECVTPFGAELRETLAELRSGGPGSRDAGANESPRDEPRTPPSPGASPGESAPGAGLETTGTVSPQSSDPGNSGGEGAGGSEGSQVKGGGRGSSGGNKTESGGGGSGGGGSGSSHPHGGPPGQTGNHPHGGPPGQTGNHPQGRPPGQSDPGDTPPGQAKKD